MYQSFTVRNFKCFYDLTLSELAHVNLIAGMNDTGKTSLLEALFIHSGINPELVVRINAFRGINLITFELQKKAEAPWDSIFSMLNTSKTIELTGNYSNYPRRTIRLRTIQDPKEFNEMSSYLASSNVVSTQSPKASLISEAVQGLRMELTEGDKTSHHDLVLDYVQSREGTQVRIHVVPLPPSSPYQTVFVPSRYVSLEEEVDRFGKLEATKRISGILKALKILEPRLTDLAIITERGTPLMAGDIGFDKFMPLPYMGEGVARLMGILLAIGYAQNGVVLIDEIENGLHYSVLEKVWRSVAEAARDFNVQIFATTHSFECINAAHNAFASRKDYDFRYYRLERIENETSVTAYTKETLSAAIKAGYEVR